MTTESEVCGLCELAPEDGQLVYEEWIAVPVCLECYLELATAPYAMIDLCQRCGSDDDVKYYSLVKASRCRSCADGIPDTTPS